jgi:hypothetical protein
MSTVARSIRVVSAFGVLSLTLTGACTNQDVVPPTAPELSAFAAPRLSGGPKVSGFDGDAQCIANLADKSKAVSVAVGGTGRLTASIKRATHIEWISNCPTIATVDAGAMTFPVTKGVTTGTGIGVVSASGTGRAKITAVGLDAQNHVVGTANFWVQVPQLPVTTVTVTSPVSVLSVGSGTALTAVATAADGSVITGQTVKWSVGPKQMGSISTAGVVTPRRAGELTVTATIGKVSGQLMLTAISEPTVRAFAIAPKTGDTLRPTESRQFTTSATWTDGATRPVGVTYRATGGVITTDGLYRAGEVAGGFTVIATCACGLADTAAVSIARAADDPAVTSPPPYAGVYGPGTNAPSWARSAGYREELFTAPLPINSQPVSEGGWRGTIGFPGYAPWSNHDGRFREVFYNPGPRVTYPVVQTPLGIKPVLQFIFPGSSGTISAAGASTIPWPTDQNVSVSVRGTWQGTLVFEWSADRGATWEPVSLKGEFSSGVGTAPSGSSTSQNGIWSLSNPISGGRLMQWGHEDRLLRVRAQTWTSGTAMIDVGMKGGEEPIYAAAGRVNSRRAYIRFLAWLDPDYTAAGVAETKGFFVGTNAGSNHYFGFVGRPDGGHDGAAQLFVQLQSPWSFRRWGGGRGPANGQWLDVELLLEMNASDRENGVARGWINGVQQLDASNIPWVPIGTDGTFTSLTLIPVHGGGKAPPRRTNSIRIAAWYLQHAP